jgi:hypothetical protein
MSPSTILSPLERRVVHAAAILAAATFITACDLSFPTEARTLSPVYLEPSNWPSSARVGDTINLSVVMRARSDSQLVSMDYKPSIGWTWFPSDRLAFLDSDSIGSARFAVLLPGPVEVRATTIPNQVLDSASVTRGLRLTVGWLEVSAGENQTCGIGWRLYFCWGETVFGSPAELATVTIPRRVQMADSVPVSIVFILPAIQLSTGDSHTCAVRKYARILTSGSTLMLLGPVVCWGVNHNGQLGLGSTSNHSRAVPLPIFLPTTGIRVSAGAAHSCLTAGGSVYCWGDDRDGRLGTNAISNRCGPEAAPCRWIPTMVPGTTTLRVSEVAAGTGYTCGLAANQVVYCWGVNEIGQLGTGDTASIVTTPTLVSGDLVFSMISAGSDHTCGVTPSGAAFCWGSNRFGQLGTRSAPDKCNGVSCARVPVPVGGGLLFQAISAGNGFTCGISSAHAAYCWGRGHEGQLGNFAVLEDCAGIRCTPRPTIVLSHVLTVSAGGAHACATIPDGDLKCWGANNKAQLGDSTVVSRSTPRSVGDPPDADFGNINSIGLIPAGDKIRVRADIDKERTVRRLP